MHQCAFRIAMAKLFTAMHSVIHYIRCTWHNVDDHKYFHWSWNAHKRALIIESEAIFNNCFPIATNQLFSQSISRMCVSMRAAQHINCEYSILLTEKRFFFIEYRAWLSLSPQRSFHIIIIHCNPRCDENIFTKRTTL